MTLLLSYDTKTGELKKSPAPFTGFLVIAAAIVSAVILFLLFLSWRDSTSRREFEVDKLRYVISWIVMGIGALGYVYFGRNQKTLPLFPNISFNETLNNTSIGETVTPPSPLYYNNTFANTTPTVSPQTNYLLYAFVAIFIVGAVYFAVVYYREALRKRKRKKMCERAELFDKKLDELGLDMFSDPKEAVVGIYKNAVLWLEVLGIPYRKSWTHWEHARNVNVSLFKEPFVGLTKLFEKAKYAPEKVTWDDAEKALELYRKMRGALNGAT